MKTLTGETLDLNDAPARGCDLFLVDGNNLAYRAFYALPPEIATSSGFPTNALLGFAGMLMKLVTDYRPRGVAVAWDTRPVKRFEMHEGYKADRKPMPDVLRTQFPHFAPMVSAFGYTNLVVEGWEADDVIATLATRAHEKKVRTCVVSTDRDAFQLVTDHVCLMMTPRGVREVLVYTPERVRSRYGIGPEQILDFIALKGDSSDNIPSVPGIGEKTAAQLVAKYGSLEGILAHTSELPPAKRRTLEENAKQAYASREIARLQRNLDIEGDPVALVRGTPDRSQLLAMFEKYEFKNLTARIPLLDGAAS